VTRPAHASERSLAPRADFPTLRECVYADTASFGIVPEPVRRCVAEFAELRGPGTALFDEAVERSLCDQARASVARLIGAEERDVALMNSATEAIGQLAWSCMPGPEANVVSIDHEFPSVTYPWLQVARRTGAEVRLANAAADPASFSIDRLAELVDERTAAICLSHVHYYTGVRLDLAELAGLAHAVGALLVIDATQSAGAVPIDVAESEIDALVSSAYKWLCGIGGAAFCFMREEVWRRLDPPFAGWRSTQETALIDATQIRLADAARRMEYQTPAHIPLRGLAASAGYVLELGVDRIYTHNTGLAARFIEGVLELGGTVVSPREEPLDSSIVTVAFPTRSEAELIHALGRRRVVFAARREGLRFSWHMFNEVGDVERVLGIMRGVLERA
jgi:selenocysteine lyase/cysteine desulfurase